MSGKVSTQMFSKCLEIAETSQIITFGISMPLNMHLTIVAEKVFETHTNVVCGMHIAPY